MHDKQVNINVREYNKFIDIVLNSTLQLIFKKPPLFEFWYIKNISKLYL